MFDSFDAFDAFDVFDVFHVFDVFDVFDVSDAFHAFDAFMCLMCLMCCMWSQLCSDRDTDTLQLCYEMGIDDHLTKPVQSFVLQTKFSQVLRRNRLRG